jgi:dTMP kinase
VKRVLIAIEGIDGAGKTTQAKILKKELKKRGYDVIRLSEPTKGKWGKKIKELSSREKNPSTKELFELFFLDRMEDVNKNIIPALEKGHTVILDRYYMSSVAYQGAGGLDPAFIESENQKIAPKPDITIILDLPPKIAVKRIEHRKSEPDYFERLKFLTKVRSIFLERYSSRSDVIIVDSTQRPNIVSNKILETVLKVMHIKQHYTEFMNEKKNRVE